MIVVSLCDLSGNAVRDWARAGFECYCVDVQHSIRRPRKERVGAGVIRFVWGDVRTWTPPARPAFVMAWPPCTDVAVSGARDFAVKGLARLTDALTLFSACHHAAAWSGAPFMIENPVGVLSSHVRRPDYTFDPCDYAGYADNPAAEAYTKKTCLWVGGGFVMPERRPVDAALGSLMHLMPPSEGRAGARSLTPTGFARAVFLANAPRVEVLAA
ncbi:MAG TPA: hypothetical protein VD948_10775 [Rhodothermales bacterium]|nr:hypothetical protein [Rhodothermales bacterium]